MSNDHNNKNGGDTDKSPPLFDLPPMSEARYKRTKMALVSSFKRFILLDQKVQAKQQHMPVHTRISTIKYWPTSEKTNLLTAIVVFYLKELGYHAERINTTGIYRKDGRGEMRYTPGGGTKGSADIHSIINGKFHAIEIKFGKDKMSDDQIKYANSIIKTGGVYMIVKTFDDLIDYLEDNET